METATDKILGKLKKLMLHKESAEKLGSIAEAEAFALKIQKLLNEYNLSLSDINLEDRKDQVKKEKADGKSPGFKGTSSYHVMRVIAKYNWCRVYTSEYAGDTTMTLIGDPQNIEVCKYLHAIVFKAGVEIGKKEYRIYVKEEKAKLFQMNKPVSRGAYMRAFLTGFKNGLEAKFKAEMEVFKKTNSKADALIVSNDSAIISYVNAHLGPIKTTTKRGGIGHGTNASDKGFEAGKAIQIAKGITSTTKPIDQQRLN